MKFKLSLYSLVLLFFVSHFIETSTLSGQPPSCSNLSSGIFSDGLDDGSHKFIAHLPTGSLSNECSNDLNVLRLAYRTLLPALNAKVIEIVYQFPTMDFVVVDHPSGFSVTTIDDAFFWC